MAEERISSAQAQELISARHVIEGSVSTSANDKAVKIVKNFGPSCKSFVWGPNWSYHGAGKVPSGFAITVDRKAPLVPDIFPASKLYNGVSVFCLGDTVRMSDGTILTRDKLIQSNNSFASEINNFLPEISSHPLDITYMPKDGPTDSLNDTRTHWEASLGDSSAFAGIYYSKSLHENYIPRGSFWLVVYAGAPKCSEDVYSIMQDRCGHHDSIGDFVTKTRELKFVFDAASRNRGRLLASLAKAFKLETKFTADTAAFQSATTTDLSRFDMLDAHISTITNRPLAVRDIVTFHSNTIDPKYTNGSVITTNPFTGVTIRRGVPSPGKPYGDSWELAAGSAFPMCTGRVQRTKDIERRVEKNPDIFKTVSSIKDSVYFVAKESDESDRFKLVPEVFRMRSKQFIQKERDMGYVAHDREIDLEPIIVKMASKTS